MIRILEEIIRDPHESDGRCTAIRTLREFPQQPEAYAPADLYPVDFELRRSGGGADNSCAMSDRRETRSGWICAPARSRRSWTRTPLAWPCWPPPTRTTGA
jgi:hypothetical protein